MPFLILRILSKKSGLCVWKSNSIESQMNANNADETN